MLERITDIFARHQITPAVARDEITQISTDEQALATGLQQLLAALSYFAVRAEEREPGEAEVGITIRRPAVKDELPALGAEFEELQTSRSVCNSANTARSIAISRALLSFIEGEGLPISCRRRVNHVFHDLVRISLQPTLRDTYSRRPCARNEYMLDGHDPHKLRRAIHAVGLDDTVRRLNGQAAIVHLGYFYQGARNRLA